MTRSKRNRVTGTHVIRIPGKALLD